MRCATSRNVAHTVAQRVKRDDKARLRRWPILHYATPREINQLTNPNDNSISKYTYTRNVFFFLELVGRRLASSSCIISTQWIVKWQSRRSSVIPNRFEKSRLISIENSFSSFRRWWWWWYTYMIAYVAASSFFVCGTLQMCMTLTMRDIFQFFFSFWAWYVK